MIGSGPGLHYIVKVQAISNMTHKNTRASEHKIKYRIRNKILYIRLKDE